jgi:uncharacterized DUF497 family protein
VSPEFDSDKNAANFAKHGVSLADGEGVLLDSLGITVENDTSEGESRSVTVGMNSFGVLMVVVWTGRPHDTRIISVRKASPQERRNYEEGV